VPESLHLVLMILIGMGMLIGLLGQLIPFFPGIPLIWISILGYGFLDGLTWKSGVVFAVITLLMIASTLVDNVLMGASARQKGTSWLSIGLGSVTMLVVSFLLTPIGGLLAGFAVIFLVEFLKHKNWRAALESLRGMGWTMVVRFFIGLAMIGLWLLWYLIL
jgi:uncharacterized protein YqgC (DUF456 family)